MWNPIPRFWGAAGHMDPFLTVSLQDLPKNRVSKGCRFSNSASRRGRGCDFWKIKFAPWPPRPRNGLNGNRNHISPPPSPIHSHPHPCPTHTGVPCLPSPVRLPSSSPAITGMPSPVCHRHRLPANRYASQPARPPAVPRPQPHRYTSQTAEGGVFFRQKGGF